HSCIIEITRTRASQRAYALFRVEHRNIGTVAARHFCRVGLDGYRHALDHKMTWTRALAAFPSVIGGPGQGATASAPDAPSRNTQVGAWCFSGCSGSRSGSGRILPPISFRVRMPVKWVTVVLDDASELAEQRGGFFFA